MRFVSRLSLARRHPQSPSSSGLTRGPMPLALAGAVWMLGSRPSMTEDGVGISASQEALCWGIAAGPSLRQNLHPRFCAYHMNPATARLRRE
ncbi:hypothetical protein Kim5_CH02792 [Rhizobium sp. Kim5]|nr:hypothetical protein Kim5_CH02792 [Rhizobium sp. Kim5]